MATISENLQISPLTRKVVELTEKATGQHITISEIPNTLDEIGVYSVALGDTEIARGTMKWEKGEYNNGGWVPALRYKHPEDAPEEGLRRVAFRTTAERYPLHIGALEELDTLLSNCLTYTYNKYRDKKNESLEIRSTDIRDTPLTQAAVRKERY